MSLVLVPLLFILLSSSSLFIMLFLSISSILNNSIVLLFISFVSPHLRACPHTVNDKFCSLFIKLLFL